MMMMTNKKTLIILRPKYTVISNPEILIRSTFYSVRSWLS